MLIDIANEERVHAGEFQRLLQILTGDEDKYMDEGREEVDEMAAEVGAAKETGGAEGSATSSAETTIGSLKD